MQAGVVALDHGLHENCRGCMRVNKKGVCIAIKSPVEIWIKGYCWARDDGSQKEKKEKLQTQFQQARCPGPWEDPLAWLAATHPPSIRDKEAILHLPAPAAKSSGNKNKRKRKMPKTSVFYNPYL